ncbi:MAG: PKD domain-containing protein, partial [Vicingaceae bacterium]
ANSFTFTNTGTTGVTYSWDFGDAGPGTSTAENPTYSFPTVGTFTVTQTVGAGACAMSTTVDITVNPMPLPTGTQDSVNCFGGNDGTASVDLPITPGPGPFGFSWAPGGQTANPAIGLTAGIYTATVTDQTTNCIGNVTVTIFEPTVLTVTEAHVDPVCNNDANGSATATPAGGTPGYTYSWDAAAGNQTTAIATGLASGSYTCSITDFNGCTQTVTATLINPAGLTLTTAMTVANCGLADGSATVTVTAGGVGPFSYLWDAATGAQTTATASNVLAGTYTVTITDNTTLCTKDTTVTVNSNAGLTATAILISDALCNGTSGFAYALPNGGTGPFTYSWIAGGSTNDTLTAIAGNYTVTITDQANNCTASDNVTIGEPLLLTASIPTSNDVSCQGANNGDATAVGAGGTVGGAYAFLWDVATGSQTTATATGLTPGTYTVYVTDDNLCIDSAQVTILDGAPILAGFTPPANQCLTGNSFTFTNTGTTGAGINFAWDFGDAGPGTSILENTAYTFAAAGTFTVEQIISDGVCADTVTGNVTVNSMPAPTAIQDSVNCFGDNDGIATVNLPIAGGTGPYTYSWNDGAGQTTNPATGLIAGNYIVTVTDGNTCIGTANITVFEPTPVVASIIGQNNASCGGAGDGDATAAGAGGTGAYTFLWDVNAGSQNTATATGLSAGVYQVYISDANLCIDTVGVTILDGGSISSTMNTTNILCFGATTGVANLTPIGGTTPYTFDWSNDGTGDFDDTEDLAGLAAGTYYVTIQDAALCSTMDTVIITEPTQLVTVLDSSFDASCNGFSDGSAFTTTNGGTGTYTYSWTTAPTQTTDDANFLAFGVYNLTVTDINNCQTTTIANINQPAPLDAISGSFDAYCSLDQGIAWISPTNGTAPYIYAWDSSGIALGTNTNDTLNGLYPGSYNIVVDDANGCKYNTIVVVNPALGGNANISASTDVSCFGGNDGTATVSTAGAFPGFTYLWDDGLAQT